MSTTLRLLAVVLLGCARDEDPTTRHDPRAAGASPAARAGAAPSTAPAITEADLRARLSIFAHDSMAGRAAGSPGHERALRYIEAEAARLGLVPMGDSAPGQRRSYRQRVPLPEGVADAGARVSWNIVALLPGTDTTLGVETVALGAHSDHVGTARASLDHDSLRAANRAAWEASGRGAANVANASSPAQPAQPVPLQPRGGGRAGGGRRDSIYNGADDDGSGSMALLEIAELLAQPAERPRRSLLFVWHTAEEIGLDGAAHFVANPTVPLGSIVAQLNLDMIGRGSARDLAGGGPDYLSVIGPRRLSTELGRWVAEVAGAQPRPLRLDYAMDADGHPENIYCRSDHALYAARGIPVAFFFTNLHEDYHEVTDEAQYIDYPHYTRIVAYLGSLAAHVGNAPRRPVVDGPPPDPRAPCRQ